jgi:conjugative transposon TraM protein
MKSEGNVRNVEHSAGFKRKRKLLLVLPVITLPFLTLAFWALGGGQGADRQTAEQSKGLQLQLPDSKLSEQDPLDKLRFYEKAEKDSLALAEWMRTDPNYRENQDSNNYALDELKMLTQSTASKYNYKLNASPYDQSQTNSEQLLLDKLTALQKQINGPGNTVTKPVDESKTDESSAVFNKEVNRLENMVALMQQNNKEDPEMRELNGTLERIMDIQHPERVKEKIKEQSSKQRGVIFPVSINKKSRPVSFFDTIRKQSDVPVSFFGIDELQEEVIHENSIEAVVHSDQTLVNGAVIRLRLTTDIYINGTFIPKGTQINGIATLNDERLDISISTIRFNKYIFPVKLEVYDMDGLTGIYIPGAISRDVAKESANSSLQQIDLITIDPSLKAQATTAGVNTIKSLVGRKVKQMKVVVKAGHKVLLRDQNNEHN